MNAVNFPANVLQSHFSEEVLRKILSRYSSEEGDEIDELIDLAEAHIAHRSRNARNARLKAVARLN